MPDEVGFRLVTLLLLVTALALSGYFRTKAEREGGAMRSAEGRRPVVVLRMLGLMILLPALGYVVDPRWVAWARFSLPDCVRWFAAVVGAGTIPILVWVFLSLGANISPTQATREGHRLVTHGPYHWVRHPLYTTSLALVASLTLVTATWWLGLGMVAALAFVTWRTPREEARLIEAFGDEYRKYMRRTGRFLPRLLR